MNRFRTLTARLVLTTVGLVAVVSILIGLATTLAMRDYLNDQLDDDVRDALGRAYAIAPPFNLDDIRGPRGPDREGQGIGTVTAIIYDDYRSGEVIADAGRGPADIEPLSAALLDLLATVPADGRVHQLRLPGLGEYRLTAEDTNGPLAVAGLPVGDVSGTIASLLRWELLLTLLGIATAAAAGLAVVRRQLAPLREVAATAHAVAELPLSEGAIDLTDRVPERLTDERNEVGQVGSALNTLLDHVESSLAVRHRSEQQVRQFVADASHELRTPLATIAGYTELARRQPAAMATALGKVESESARMTSLVEDLLLLARLDSGRPLADDTVDLTKLLLEAVGDARVVGPDHTWRLVLPDEPVEVRGDEQRLHQVATNLLTNARKHTPAGTTVTVTATTDGFVVHDDGPGFPAELVDHAFERFVRADEARTSTGGVGLGLALVDAIVSAHGGRVTLTSKPGDTSFAVSLR